MLFYLFLCFILMRANPLMALFQNYSNCSTNVSLFINVRRIGLLLACRHRTIAI